MKQKRAGTSQCCGPEAFYLGRGAGWSTLSCGLLPLAGAPGFFNLSIGLLRWLTFFYSQPRSRNGNLNARFGPDRSHGQLVERIF
jgi:hypothetical protein